MKTNKMIYSLSLIITLVCLPIVFTDAEEGFIKLDTVSADIGTCCPQPSGACVIGQVVIARHYAIEPGGPCPNPGQLENESDEHLAEN